ncbi:1-acylglycerol-3-phosphate O-acyltransferase [Orbaceae bacterium ESL0721]|nr:1-acylglycerol-3-phosphate O-acyltransferase [Orbaceae bacterium ESL0721]
MILFFRALIILTLGTLISIIGTLLCLFNPRNPKNVARFAHLFGTLFSPLIGVKIINRINPANKPSESCIYIANHQNNYDMIVAGNIVQPKTVTVGKKSLAWIPFFGQLYYLTGNILIDRENKAKARNTIVQVANEIKRRDISAWMFPEGTRSHGQGLLPFKTGAFRAAISAGVPIVPICISNSNNINLNRLNNGHMIVEMLAPIETKDLNKEDVRSLMNHCYEMMSTKIAELNQEVKILDKK